MDSWCLAYLYSLHRSVHYSGTRRPGLRRRGKVPPAGAARALSSAAARRHPYCSRSHSTLVTVPRDLEQQTNQINYTSMLMCKCKEKVCNWDKTNMKRHQSCLCKRAALQIKRSRKVPCVCAATSNNWETVPRKSLHWIAFLLIKVQMRNKMSTESGGPGTPVSRTSKIGRYKICIHFMNHLLSRRTSEDCFISRFYIRGDVLRRREVEYAQVIFGTSANASCPN